MAAKNPDQAFNITISSSNKPEKYRFLEHCRENSGNLDFLLFSSPEHKVLMVSFCDRPMSGVLRPSCVVHNFFKYLLLLNHWANLDETWQGCSLGEEIVQEIEFQS